LIRKYRPSDRERVLAITAAAFEGVSIDYNIEQKFGPIGGRGWRDRKLDSVDMDLAHTPAAFVAEEGGTVVGYITTRVSHQDKIGGISNMAVDPAWGHRGIGRRLMQAALDFLRAEGMEYARIETLEQNEIASVFYPKMGFTEIARQIHYIMKLSDEDSKSR